MTGAVPHGWRMCGAGDTLLDMGAWKWNGCVEGAEGGAGEVEAARGGCGLVNSSFYRFYFHRGRRGRY